MLFDKVIGHEKQIAILKRDIENNNMAQSYILSGAEGIGKHLLVMIAARYLNCLSPANGDACGSCESCLKFTIQQEGPLLSVTSTHPDIEVLEPEWKDDKGKQKKNPIIKVDEIRRFQDNIYSKAYAGKYKVGIIDHGDMMNKEAANSLLKTLEEPPENVVIFVITSLFTKLLPTIRSRCRTVNFHSLPTVEIANFLTATGVSQDKADIISFVSMGSLGNAIKTDHEEVFSVLRDAAAFLQLFFTNKVAERYIMMEQYAKKHDVIRLEKFLWYLQLILSHFITESRKAEILRKGFFKEETFQVLNARLTHDVVTSSVWMIDRVRVDLKHNLNTHLLLEIMNIKFKEILDRSK